MFYIILEQADTWQYSKEDHLWLQRTPERVAIPATGAPDSLLLTAHLQLLYACILSCIAVKRSWETDVSDSSQLFARNGEV